MSERLCPACGERLSMHPAEERFCFECGRTGRDLAYLRGLAEGRAPLEAIIQECLEKYEQAEIDARRAGAFNAAVNAQHFADLARAGKIEGLLRGTPVKSLMVQLGEDKICIVGDINEVEFLDTVSSHLNARADKLHAQATEAADTELLANLIALQDQITKLFQVSALLGMTPPPEETP